MTVPPLTRAERADIKNLLTRKKERDGRELFVVEGEKAVRDMITAKASPSLVLIDGDTCPPQYATNAMRRMSLADARSLTTLVTPPKIMAVFPRSRRSWDELDLHSDRPGVLLDRVQDPGNIGTIIRTAAAFAVPYLLLGEGCADAYSPKVVRAAAGALAAVPILTDVSLAEARRRVAVCAALPRGAPPLSDMTLPPPPTVLAFGSEGQGLRQTEVRHAAAAFTIPVRGGDSLNVAVSCAIALYHLTALQ